MKVTPERERSKHRSNEKHCENGFARRSPVRVEEREIAFPLRGRIVAGVDEGRPSR